LVPSGTQAHKQKQEAPRTGQRQCKKNMLGVSENSYSYPFPFCCCRGVSITSCDGTLLRSFVLLLILLKQKASHPAPPWRAPDLHQGGNSIGDYGKDIFCNQTLFNDNILLQACRASSATALCMIIVLAQYSIA
jgi:hypothetical protein